MTALKIDHSEKLKVFSKAGSEKWDAQFPIPPVHTTLWNSQDWTNWVDNNGNWFWKG